MGASASDFSENFSPVKFLGGLDNAANPWLSRSRVPQLPRLFQRFASALLLRRLSADLGRIAIALDVQTQLLARLADRFAPRVIDQSPGDRATVKADTGVTHLDPVDAGLALDFIARTQAHTGHVPDEEEILIYLADEKTHDLATRLSQRDEELSRLMESRR